MCMVLQKCYAWTKRNVSVCKNAIANLFNIYFPSQPIESYEGEIDSFFDLSIVDQFFPPLSEHVYKYPENQILYVG
jgi:hypothetical protein